MTARRHRAQDVDRHVGARVRDLRVVAGLSQGMLGELIGVTYQQQAKYESGVNRISASRLFALATALDRDVGEFFEGLEAPVAASHIVEQRQVVDLALNFRRLLQRRTGNCCCAWRPRWPRDDRVRRGRAPGD